MSAISLYALNEYLRRVIQLNFSAPVWIDAELAQVSESKGHWYLELVEKAPEVDQVIARAQGIIWARTFKRLQRTYQKQADLEQILAPGATCRLQVEVSFSERFGYSLHILDIDPDFSLGQLALQREKTLQALQEAGLLGLNQQLVLARMPQRIAVLSAAHAAGYQDFLDQLHHNPYGFQFATRLFPISVQGQKVGEDLQQQILALNQQQKHFDAVVLVRGGGSKLDLMAFDQFEVCSQLAKIPLPLITGIGHEIDTSLADLVAHTALKTPTAVAEFFLQKALLLDSQLLDCRDQIYRLGKQQTQLNLLNLQRLRQQWHLSIQTVLQRHQVQIDQMENLIRVTCQQEVIQQQLHLQNLEAQIQLLDPQNTLQRGYTLTTDAQGNRIFSAEKAIQEAKIITHFRDGTVQSKPTK